LEVALVVPAGDYLGAAIWATSNKIRYRGRHWLCLLRG